MGDNFEKKIDQKKPDNEKSAGQSSNFDLSRHLLGADGRRNTSISQSRLFKDYISYTSRGSDVLPQHAEETLSTSFRHDAPDQELPMSALGSLEMTRDGELLRQADNHYAQGNHENAEQLLRYVLDNYPEDPKQNVPQMELALHGMAQLDQKKNVYGDAAALNDFLIRYHAMESQEDDRMIGAAMNRMGKIYMKLDAYNEARQVFKSIVGLCVKEFGVDDLRTAKAIELLANVHKKIADTTENPEQRKKEYKKVGVLLRDFVLPIYGRESDPGTEKVQNILKDLPVELEQKPSRGTEKLISGERANILLDFVKYHKRWPDLLKPTLFNDKVLHRILFDRRPERKEFADRLGTRKYVTGKIGEEYLPKLLTEEPITDSSQIPPFENLPDRFVIKFNPSGGGKRVIVVRDKWDKSKYDESEIRKTCQQWFENDDIQKTGRAEYKGISPCILIEEYIDDGKGLAPRDYKFFTYNGEPHFIEVEADRFENYSSTWHDTKWNRLEMTHGGEMCPNPIDKPPHLEEMLKLVGQLGESHDFLRIDFYDTPQGVYVGEITSAPARGMGPFKPFMFERKFGEHWKDVHNKWKGEPLSTSKEVHDLTTSIAFAWHTLSGSKRQ